MRINERSEDLKFHWIYNSVFEFTPKPKNPKPKNSKLEYSATTTTSEQEIDDYLSVIKMIREHLFQNTK